HDALCPYSWASFNILSVVYAMMELRTSMEPKHLAGRRRSGLCGGGGSGRGRMTSRTLQRQFDLDDAALEALKEARFLTLPQMMHEDGCVVVETRDPRRAPASPAAVPSATASGTRREPEPRGAGLDAVARRRWHTRRRRHGVADVWTTQRIL